MVETNVLDAGVINAAGASTSGTINGSADDPFQASLALPMSGTGGASLVEALIFDQATGLYQDRCTESIRIAPPCDTYEDLRQPPPASRRVVDLHRRFRERQHVRVELGPEQGASEHRAGSPRAR